MSIDRQWTGSFQRMKCKRIKASKVKVLLSPVAYLMYARWSVITVCRQIELTIVRAMLKLWKGCKIVVNYGHLQYFEWQ